MGPRLREDDVAYFFAWLPADQKAVATCVVSTGDITAFVVATQVATFEQRWHDPPCPGLA
jgi:hypothetical protein